VATDRVAAAASVGSPAGRTAIAAANTVDGLISALCRFIILVTGIALTVILTGGVVARYVFAAGGIDAAQELPERLFPWFIMAGVALAAQAGGHMAVEWLLDMLGTRGKRWLLLLGNALVMVSYLVLLQQALEVAEIAAVERSPVLDLSGSHGHWAVALGCALLALATLCASVRIALAGPDARFTLAYKEI
jgi:TRAP-type C4-dicarboxylate transport system permease small subunit